MANAAAAVVETRADLINIIVEELARLSHELPVFRTLDDIAEQAHAHAQAELHLRIAQRLSASQREWLDRLG